VLGTETTLVADENGGQLKAVRKLMGRGMNLEDVWE